MSNHYLKYSEAEDPQHSQTHPIFVNRCPAYGDGYVCDLDEGHEEHGRQFHFDYVACVHWTDHMPEAERKVSVAFWLVIASSLSMLAYFGWAIWKVTQ